MTPRPIYFKRYRMELDLTRVLPVAPWQSGFEWWPWNAALLEAHAEAKYLSFREEMDSQVFPSLGHLDGCLELMQAIRDCPGFCPQATWLAATSDGVAGTVQGLRDASGFGAIQNLGVVPSYRGNRLGAALLAKALHGFRQVGVRGVYLEVTAKNDAAVRLYRSFGFRCTRTIYKLVVVESVPMGMGI